jgi:hypothetical protein
MTAKEWRDANKEHRAEYIKNWREKNPEHVSEYNLAWRRANPKAAVRRATRWAKKHPDRVKDARSRWRDRYPDRYRAHYLLESAIKSGRVVKPDTCPCGAPNPHGHHPDYSKPLMVVWLCRDCHNKLHRDDRDRAKLTDAPTISFKG